MENEFFYECDDFKLSDLDFRKSPDKDDDSSFLYVGSFTIHFDGISRRASFKFYASDELLADKDIFEKCKNNRIIGFSKYLISNHRKSHMVMKRYFIAWFFLNWDINIGLSICLSHPNIEIHFPFGFCIIGWKKGYLTKEKGNGPGFGYRYGMVVEEAKRPIFRKATIIDNDKD